MANECNYTDLIFVRCHLFWVTIMTMMVFIWFIEILHWKPILNKFMDCRELKELFKKIMREEDAHKRHEVLFDLCVETCVTSGKYEHEKRIGIDLRSMRTIFRDKRRRSLERVLGN